MVAHGPANPLPKHGAFFDRNGSAPYASAELQLASGAKAGQESSNLRKLGQDASLTETSSWDETGNIGSESWSLRPGTGRE
jgi:hypothetical protein